MSGIGAVSSTPGNFFMVGSYLTVGVTLRSPWPIGRFVTEVFFSSSVGSPNDASNYWTVSVADGSGAVGSFTTAAEAVNSNTAHSIAVNALMANTRGYATVTVTKTGTPGALVLMGQAVYR